MKKLHNLGWAALAQLLVAQSTLAAGPGAPTDPANTGGGGSNGGSTDVPEMDGPGAVLAVSLMVSVVFFIREKIRKK